MQLKDFADKLGMKVLAGDDRLDREVAGMYICDLLSWVMSHAEKGNAWITVHTHINIIAVALLTEVACIIIPEGIEVEKATIEKARQEGVAILSSTLSAYDISRNAAKLGI